MLENSEQLEHRERQAGGSWLVGLFVVLPLLYVLSPPWVALMAGPNYFEHAWFIHLYTPLIFLSEEFDFVNNFYEAYFKLAGVL